MRHVPDAERRIRLALRHALEAEAAQLTGWLDGQRISTVYPSPAMKSHREDA